MIDPMDHTGLAGFAVEKFVGLRRGDQNYDDYFQVAMIGVVKASRRWPGEGKFSTYATAAARNELRAHLGPRRRWFRDGLLAGEARWPKIEPAAKAQHDYHDADAIWEVVNSVAPEEWQREVLRLAFGAGLAPHTISTHTNRGVRTIRRLIDRARQKVEFHRLHAL